MIALRPCLVLLQVACYMCVTGAFPPPLPPPPPGARHFAAPGCALMKVSDINFDFGFGNQGGRDGADGQVVTRMEYL